MYTSGGEVGLTETEEDGECSWTKVWTGQLNSTDEAKAVAGRNPKY